MTYTFRNQASRLKLDRLVALLTKPHTRQQAAAALHMAEQTVGQYLAHLGTGVHVVDWVRTGRRGALTEVYLIGEGADKPKPVSVAPEKAYRKRRDADPDRREAYLNRRKADYLIAKRKKADPVVCAIFTERTL